ncbi:PAS domain S-box protein (macronuclear) [Tetrahymena thermophila SB210]|uniref:PAS domain S-box protein n=1 Tax=Tetrahymena thermophila (strain SB210) TaxID=312017 RepID=Q22AC8_TETTS|nr:PAS domain S-box protein [Tetrahymena thermophila SB210]EAR82246.2 PAS domain S-box protein [Tetrahymena thermophila SB210]|eukprot:XP_001029909.2 PAS domain S-box protein [Tetrahymena thermophila SB210]
MKQAENMFDQFSNQTDILQCSASKFLVNIRILFDHVMLSQENYLQGGQGIKYETIIQIHEQNCKNRNQSCFCSKYRRSNDNQTLKIEEFQAQQFRIEYANKVILELFEIYIHSNHQNDNLSQLKLSHLNYLYDIINDPVRVLVYLQQMSISYLNDQNIGLNEKFYFQSLKEQILSDYQMKIFDSNIENQNINMMEVILFDEKINVLKEKMQKVLFKVGHFYDFLCGNFICLDDLESMYSPLINLKKELEQIIIDLFQINSEDLDLQYLTSIYTQLLDFQNRRIKEFQETAKQISIRNSNKQKKVIQINQELSKTCVLFTSLIGKDFLVNKSTNQFKKIFGYDSDYIQGKPLNLLIPNMLKKHHNQMIQQFIDEQSMNIIIQGERNVFAQDKNGFVFPISLRIKIQVFENDFGVCSLIQKQKQVFSYMFFENQGIVTDFSKKIFLDIFQSHGYKIGTQFNIFDLVPSLESIVQTKQLNKESNGFLIIKDSSNLVPYQKQTPLENYVQSPKNINNYFTLSDQVFHIKFKYFKYSTKNQVDANYIQIISYQKETCPVKKMFILDELNKQKILKESQSFQKNDENQQSLDILNSLQQQFFSTRDFSQIIENQDLININIKEDCLNSLQKQQSKTDKTLNLKEIYKLQHQSNYLHQKQLQDLRFQKNFENQTINTYLKQNDIKYIISSGVYDKQNQELQYQTINSPVGVSTNLIEYPEMILSPIILSQERQQILIKPDEQLDSMLQLNQQNQLDCQNFQETSLIKNSSHRKLNKIFNKKNKNVIENNSLSITSNSCNPFKEESLGDGFPYEQKNKNFKEQEELRDELKNEIASVNSSKFSTEEIMKRKMIQKIKKTEFTKGLYLMNISGFLAFIILSIVSLIIYFQNLNSLDSFIHSFLKIDDAIYCFIDVMNLLGISNYQSLMGFSQSFILDSLDLQKNEYNQTDYQQQVILQDYNSNFQKLVLDNDSGDQLYDLQNNMFQIQIYAAGFYNNAQGQQNQITTFQQSLQYTLGEFFYEIALYYLNYEEQQEDFIWGNIYNFKQRMKNLQLIVQNYAKDQFNNMNLYQTFAIILFAIISTILIFSILPLFAVIQVQKEKILKLFGTFSPSIIESQIKQIELGLFKIEQNSLQGQIDSSANMHKKNLIQKKCVKKILDFNFNSNQHIDEAQKNLNMSLINQIPRYIPRQLDKRNRQMASFSNVKKFNLILFLFGIVAVALLIIIPILNLVVFNPFQIESKATLQDRISLIDIFSLIIENLSPNMEQIYLIFSSSPTSTSYYQTYLQDLQNQNSESFQFLQDLTSDFQGKRNNQGMYVDFYQNLLNSNVCQVRQNYPQYFNSNITESNCNNLFNGILQRGLIFSVQKVFQTFQELYQIYSIQDINQVTDEFIYFQTYYNHMKIN